MRPVLTNLDSCGLKAGQEIKMDSLRPFKKLYFKPSTNLLMLFIPANRQINLDVLGLKEEEENEEDEQEEENDEKD